MIEFTANTPVAWNVGPEGAPAAVSFCMTVLQVYPPADEFVRRETGSLEARALIRRGDETLAVLKPEQFVEALRYWGQVGVFAAAEKDKDKPKDHGCNAVAFCPFPHVCR